MKRKLSRKAKEIPKNDNKTATHHAPICQVESGTGPGAHIAIGHRGDQPQTSASKPMNPESEIDNHEAEVQIRKLRKPRACGSTRRNKVEANATAFDSGT